MEFILSILFGLVLLKIIGGICGFVCTAKFSFASGKIVAVYGCIAFVLIIITKI